MIRLYRPFRDVKESRENGPTVPEWPITIHNKILLSSPASETNGNSATRGWRISCVFIMLC